MAQQDPARDEFVTGDPWHAFGYLVSGIAFYGLLGGLADWWAGTSFLVGIGIVVGAVLGIFLTWSRFRPEPDPDRAPAAPTDLPTSPPTQEKQ